MEREPCATKATKGKNDISGTTRVATGNLASSKAFLPSILR
jgi:hypothetical protein